MTDNLNFVRQIDSWIAKTERNFDTVYKSSVADVARIANTPISAGGRMPVATGALMNSICLTGSAGSFLGNVGVRAGILASSALSSIRLGWNASYAVYVEFGTATTPARAFIRSASQQWQGIIEFHARRVNT